MTIPLTTYLTRRYLPPLAAMLLLLGCNVKPAPPTVGPAAETHPREVAMARGKIEVQGGLLELSPAQDGLVQTLAVKEGQEVQRGQLLLRLAGNAAAADLAVAESELQLARAKHQAHAQRLPALRRAAARLSEAAAAGAAEPQRAEEAQQSLLDAEAELAVSQAEADVAHSRLMLVRTQNDRLELRAPESGLVVRVNTQAGQRVVAQPAITLLPRRPLIVRAELNESYATQVRVGLRAYVTTDGDSLSAALPSARVVRMSPVLGNGRLNDDTQRGPVRVIECVLAFDQAPMARVGQNVRVSFHE